MKRKIKQRRNCYNCKWLEWIDGDINDPSGYCCNNREESNKLFANLERHEYRNKGKVCHEQRE